MKPHKAINPVNRKKQPIPISCILSFMKASKARTFILLLLFLQTMNVYADVSSGEAENSYIASKTGELAKISVAKNPSQFVKRNMMPATIARFTKMPTSNIAADLITVMIEATSPSGNSTLNNYNGDKHEQQYFQQISEKRITFMSGTNATKKALNILDTVHHKHDNRKDWYSKKSNILWDIPESTLPANTDLYRTPSARFIREVSQDQMDRCRMFVEGDTAKNEFYSPDFPNDYPKNINCTRIIEAPQGQIIRLDFRNSFHIEAKEECKFDFLEIRDGAYGFSNLIGKFCGSDFPPEITSKERFLWLHFHSDESIEYSGFTAVYEFMDRSREAPSTDLNCTLHKDGYEGWINSTEVPQDKMEAINRYKVPLDCMWRVQVADNWKIQLKFFEFKLAKPNYCDINFLDIFPEETVMPLRVKNFCGSAGESITSETNILHIRYYAEPSAINSTAFSILFTAFRDRGAACVEGEYDCEDATCISDKLICNKRDNCKFRWDEEGCENETQNESEHVIIIVTVFGLILGGMMVTFVVNCVRKIMRDQKIIREHIRQSKESKLNEIGRMSKSSSKIHSGDELSEGILSRLKGSETSLEDISIRYPKTVPLAIVPQKIDYRNETYPVLQKYHDGECSPYSSSTTTAELTPQFGDSHAIEEPRDTTNYCDMGCQTRESLFSTILKPNGSISSTLGISPLTSSQAKNVVPPAPPPTTCRRNHQRPQSHFSENENMAMQCNVTIPPQQKPLKQCRHHQHMWQQEFKVSDPEARPEKLSMLRQDTHKNESLYKPESPTPGRQKHFRSKAIVPIGTISATTATATSTKLDAPLPISINFDDKKSKEKKVEPPKNKKDIRNSAPDVIIMTSH